MVKKKTTAELLKSLQHKISKKDLEKIAELEKQVKQQARKGA